MRRYFFGLANGCRREGPSDECTAKSGGHRATNMKRGNIEEGGLLFFFFFFFFPTYFVGPP